jgi:hypothetical protein
MVFLRNMYETPFLQQLRKRKEIPWAKPQYLKEFAERELEHLEIPHLVTKFDPNPHEVTVRKHTARFEIPVERDKRCVSLVYDLCILYNVLQDKHIHELAAKSDSDLELVIQGALRQDKLRERVTIFYPLPYPVLSAEPNMTYDEAHCAQQPYNPPEMVQKVVRDLRMFFHVPI